MSAAEYNYQRLVGHVYCATQLTVVQTSLWRHISAGDTHFGNTFSPDHKPAGLEPQSQRVQEAMEKSCVQVRAEREKADMMLCRGN